ncbi:MAG: hypothetical protein GWN51_06675, partial [Gemmatimonadetes bacterium]|nr:hypothetical protein [Gemmatimonadota bacterium]NIT66705.1 hypothetical protein [Gemmatimonadota bacterium]NIV23322.1 hypothetical protein [Gemmatimonadota bacterium]NIW75136.1 hypothetical protein [Gemmatimonadota bacterium]NIY35282.1 hypothetical protein [Gemmatimonadota bacterium]
SAEIQRTVQSTRAYRYVDGVEEIWRGVVFLLLGGAFFFADALGRDYLYAATAIVIALTLTSRILAPRLSERITADR